MRFKCDNDIASMNNKCYTKREIYNNLLSQMS